MKLQDAIPVTGQVTIYKSKGVPPKLLPENIVSEKHNLVVNTGNEWIARRLAFTYSPAPNQMSNMAIGTGTAAPTMTDVGLEQEVGRAGGTTTQATSNRVAYSCTIPENVGTGPITEAGIFDELAANTGNMMARSVFPVVNKEIDDYITVLWVITVGTCA